MRSAYEIMGQALQQFVKSEPPSDWVILQANDTNAFNATVETTIIKTKQTYFPAIIMSIESFYSTNKTAQ